MLLNTSLFTFLLAFILASDSFAIQAQIVQAQCRKQCTKTTCKSQKQYDYCKKLCDPKSIVDCLKEEKGVIASQTTPSTHLSNTQKNTILDESIQNMNAMYNLLNERMVITGLSTDYRKHPQKIKSKVKRTENEIKIYQKFSELGDFIKQKSTLNSKDYANKLAQSLSEVNVMTCNYAHQRVKTFIQEFPEILRKTLSELNTVQREYTGFSGYIKKKWFSHDRRKDGMMSKQEQNELKIKTINTKLQKLYEIGQEFPKLDHRLELKCKIAKDPGSEDIFQGESWGSFLTGGPILSETEEVNKLSKQAENLHATSLKQWNKF